MGKSTSTFFSAPTQSRLSNSVSSGDGIFFERNRGATAALVLGLTACGGGGGDSSSTSDTTIPTAPTPIPVVPLTSIPTSATALIELGPISGGSVIFKLLNGSTIISGGTNPDGSLNYNPRDLVSKMGSEQWLVAHVSGGVDTDANDDGIIDLTPTSINGSFRMLIPRSSLENGQKIIVNPRAGAVSESILSRASPVITDENLDHIARETGADDQNNDGIVNYRDLTSIQMKNVTGISQIVPSVSGYIASIHSGNQANKLASLSNIARTENHIVASIIPNPNQADHTPALKLTTVSSGSTILYTLDGSSPVQGGSGTRIANSGIVIPFQNAKLLYREQYNLNGSTVYGKVEQFNLNADWTELSQRKIAYNVNGKATQLIENLSYKNTTYTITSYSNKISSGYVYPKTIDCQVGTKSTDGCQYGPYLAWSPEHEARIRSRIMEEVKIFIDANTIVLPPPNLVDIFRNAISYRGSSYTIKNTYTLDTTNNVRVFPVIIDATVTLKNGQSTTLVRKANNQSELNTYNAQLEQQAKDYIDANTIVLPPPNLVDIIRNAISYRGSSYTIKNTYTLDTTNNVRVFPVIIDATVTLKNGQSTTLVRKANNQSELNTYNAQLEQQAKDYIDANTIVLPPPNLVDIFRNAISYRGSSYTIKNTYTLDTTNNVRVFPVIIDATVTLKNGQSTTLVRKANNQSELNTYNAQLEQQAKDYIDANTIVLPPPNLVDIFRNAISYRGSSYTIKNTYTLDTTNNVRVFPVIIDATVTLKNGQSTTLVRKANNQSELNTYNAQLEQQAKDYIDANTIVLPPPNLVDIFRNAISYRGSSYTIKNTYTLDTTNNVRVFPVIIDATVTLKNGQSTTLVRKANNQSELNTYNAQLEQQAKDYIDANTIVLPPPNLVDIFRNAISYRGSSYTIKNTYTLDTTNNVRVFPVIIDATVTLKNGQSTTLVRKANNQSELNTYNAQLEQQAKDYIDANTIVLPPPNLVDIIRNAISYRGSSYTIKNTYTLDTTNNVRVFPVIIDATVTLKNGQSTTLVRKANNQSELNTYNAQLEQQAKDYIDANTIVLPPPNLVDIFRNAISYRGSSYTIKNTYTLDTTNNVRVFPVIIDATVTLKNGQSTTLVRKANNQSELNTYNAQLEQQAKDYIDANTVAFNFSISQENLFSLTKSRITNILPFSSAHADVLPGWGIKVQSSRTQLPPFTSYDSTTVVGKFLGNSSLVDHYVKNTNGKGGVGGVTIDQAELRQVISTIQNSAEQIRMIGAQCSFTGTTLPSPTSNGCILSPAQREQIRGHENKIFEQIGNFLRFGGGLSVGAGAAIYEEIMGIGSDVVELADGTTLQAFENNLSSLKAEISEYIVNYEINYSAIKSKLLFGKSAIEEELKILTDELPSALKRLDSYSAGYYTGKIGGGMILELLPNKRIKLITRGFSVGKWASTARYIVDSAKAGHSGTKMVEIAEKLRNVNWSKVDKPDISKIANPYLVSVLKEDYKIASTIGNGSTADAIRYTRETGLLLGDLNPTDHIKKGKQLLEGIQKRFNANDLNPTDRKIAEDIFNDITNALKGN